MTDALDQRLALAVSMARAAGELTLAAFRSPELLVERKGDGSPVTAADRAAERLLRERIAAAFPADAVLGEEEGSTAGTSGYEWILDPIDGTESFARGVPLFGTLVACEHAGEVALGVIACPAARELVYAARGRGAFWSVGGGPPRVARVSDTPRLDQALVSSTSLAGLDRKTSRGARERLLAAARKVRGWSDCYAYLLVATGRADAAFDGEGMQVWDNAALEPIVLEAGGRFSDLRGERTIRGGSALASNGLLHDELLSLFAGPRG
jgi:histidinol-phosphatase